MKTKSNDIKISRGSGSFWVFNQELQDRGAFVNFENQNTLRNSNLETPLKIHFGYKSEGSKIYQRDLYLEWSELIELRNYLNQVIETQLPNDEFLYIHIDPNNSLVGENSIESNYKGTIELTGFDLVAFNNPNSNDPIFHIERNIESNSSYYFPVYSLQNEFSKILEQEEQITSKRFNPIYYLRQIRIESLSKMEFGYYRRLHNYWDLKEDYYDFEGNYSSKKKLFEDQGLSEIEIESNLESIIQATKKKMN